jgi:hypothetical protein
MPITTARTPGALAIRAAGARARASVGAIRSAAGAKVGVAPRARGHVTGQAGEAVGGISGLRPTRRAQGQECRPVVPRGS